MDQYFPYDFQDQRIAYIRLVEKDDLPDEILSEIGELDEMYAIVNADGEPIALAEGRSQAFEFARLNEYAPVSVH